MHFAAKAASLLVATLFLTLGFSIGGSAEGGEPTLLFDSYTGERSTTNRGADDSCGSLVTIDKKVTITNVAIRTDPNPPVEENTGPVGNIRYLIFDHTTHLPVFISDPQPIHDRGEDWYVSDAFPGVSIGPGDYDIGAILDIPHIQVHDNTAEDDGIFHTTSSNPNFEGPFDNPNVEEFGHAASDCVIQLFGDGKAGPPTETNVFTCTFPDDGMPFRGKQRCDLLDTVVGAKQGGTITHHQSECRYHYDEGGPMKRIRRDTIVPDGANIKIVCRNSVVGDVTIDLNPAVV